MTPQDEYHLAPPPTLPAPRHWSRNPAIVIALVVGVLGLMTLITIGSSIYLARRAYGSFYAVSESMHPTLRVGDRFVTDRNAFKNGVLPDHGDIVVFAAPPEATAEHKEGVLFVMRVVALPGETIQVTGARIMIGDQVLSDEEGLEPHQFLREQFTLTAEQPVRISRDHVQVDTADTFTPETLAKKLGRADAQIHLQPGQILVNGKPEKADFRTHEDPGYDFPAGGGSLKVPPGHIFVMGDNRNRAADSHIWGPLDVKRLQGRVIFTTGTK